MQTDWWAGLGYIMNCSTISFSMLNLSWSLIFVSAVSCIIHFCFIRSASVCRQYFIFLASNSCTNLVSLSLPCLTYSLRPTTVALYVDSSSTYPHPPFRLLMQSLLTSVFRWWIPSIIRAFTFFDLPSQFLFLNSWLFRCCKLGLVQLRCW